MSKDQTWVKLEPWLQPQHANNVPKLVAFTGQKMPLQVGFQQTCSCTNAEVIYISACLCCMDFCLFVCLFLAEMDSNILRSRWTDCSHQSWHGAGKEGLVRVLQSQTLPHSRPLRAIKLKHNNKQTLCHLCRSLPVNRCRRKLVWLRPHRQQEAVIPLKVRFRFLIPHLVYSHTKCQTIHTIYVEDNSNEDTF